MAATVSAWAKPGAWALDSEEHESELLKDNGSHDNSSNNGDAAAHSDFPSLTAAAATKPKKKSKGQKLSLQELQNYSAPKQLPSKGLTIDEMSALPTGPRERSADEIDRPRLGGGFKSYGYDRPGRDEQPRRQRDRDTEFTPSRADEIDDWGANKKSAAGNGFDRREKGERGGFFPDSKSKADEVDNWVSSKSFVPSDTRRSDRRGGFESNGTGGGADSDNWLKKKEEEGRRYGNSFDSLREKRGGLESSNGGGTDSDTWSRKGGEEATGGRPRLNLQPRTLPVGEGQQLDASVAKPKGSNPFGDARPRDEVLQPRTLPVGEGQQLDGIVAKPKASNPFGNARPREEVLKEKGQDPKEIEAKLEAVKVNGPAGADGPPAFGKRGFGTGGWRGSSPEEKKERSWRKPEPLDASRPTSSSSGAGPVEAVEDGGDAQNGGA